MVGAGVAAGVEVAVLRVVEEVFAVAKKVVSRVAVSRITTVVVVVLRSWQKGCLRSSLLKLA